MKKKKLLTDKSGQLYEEYAEEAAKILQEEIDWKIMSTMMEIAGWTKININFPTVMPDTEAHEIKEWCKINLKGNYKGRGKDWLFEKEKDASIFVLRWS